MNLEERTAYGDIGRKGLWENNTALVQLLGLCPLLAVSNTLVNAVSLSLATVLVMALASGAVAALRTLIPHEIRIPVFILIIAALVTCLDLAFNAWLHDLYLVLGIFIPLIVTNCIVLARVEAFAAKNPPLQSTFDGIFMGVGMLWTLALLGIPLSLMGAVAISRRLRQAGARGAADLGFLTYAVSNVAVLIAGSASGRVTLRIVRHGPAPRMFAASSICVPQ